LLSACGVSERSRANVLCPCPCTAWTWLWTRTLACRCVARVALVACTPFGYRSDDACKTMCNGESGAERIEHVNALSRCGTAVARDRGVGDGWWSWGHGWLVRRARARGVTVRTERRHKQPFSDSTHAKACWMRLWAHLGAVATASVLVAESIQMAGRGDYMHWRRGCPLARSSLVPSDSALGVVVCPCGGADLAVRWALRAWSQVYERCTRTDPLES